MSESQTSTAVAGEQNNEQIQDQGKGFTAITSQADFDTAIQARLARERAKFDGFDDFKAKAEKFTELENANKTETERAQAALAEAQAQLVELTAAKTRAEVAAAKGVPAGLLSGSTQADLEASADALIQFRGEKADTSLVIPNEGNSPRPAPSDEKAFVSELFSSGD